MKAARRWRPFWVDVSRSLTGRLLVALAAPMLVAAVALGLGGAWWIEEMVEGVNDRILAAASRAIAESLTVEDSEIELQLSPAIFGMLENNARDNVFYSVRHRGELLSGYADLPTIGPARIRDTQVEFGKGTYLGRPVRIVAEGRSLPQIDSPVVIEVAETLDARERIAKRMFVGLFLLEFALIALAAVFVPLAVRWGLRPLEALRRDMEERGPSDLATLPLEPVPVELHGLVNGFNSMLRRLDSAIRGIRRFTADASHQMRTPLTILRTHIANYRRVDPRSAEAAAAIGDIDQASERLSHLLVQLLALARADAAAPAAVELEELDLHEIAATVASDYAMIAVRAGVDLSLSRSPGSVLAIANAAIAVELVANLVNNAIRYAGEGEAVVLEVTVLDRDPAIVIEDSGPGIPPADRARALVRFARLGDVNAVSGSGLGLPIAVSLAQSIGAVIELETARAGRGLRAQVRFKRSDRAAV